MVTGVKEGSEKKGAVHGKLEKWERVSGEGGEWVRGLRVAMVISGLRGGVTGFGYQIYKLLRKRAQVHK